MANMDEIEVLNTDNVNEKLEKIHQDIKRLMEKSNQEYLELMVKNLRNDFTRSIITYLRDDAETSLDKNMEICEMKPTCKEVFTDFLGSNTELLNGDNVSKTSIKEKKDELVKIREKAPYGKCETCFSEVQTLFNKQLNLIRSNDIYNSTSVQEEKPKISSIAEEKMVKEVLEPLSNRQRLQILKEMSCKAQSFSALSELTGLRGGNLLFHIQKLQDSDLIIQRHERGDYMITNKGFNLLMLLADFQRQL